MNAIQQLMVAIISVVLGATSSQVFKTMTDQEMKILFWVSMLLLVWIFLWSALRSTKKSRAKPRRPPKPRKRKKGKRRARGP
jgi:uncharacterized membrane protein YfcA